MPADAAHSCPMPAPSRPACHRLRPRHAAAELGRGDFRAPARPRRRRRSTDARAARQPSSAPSSRLKPGPGAGAEPGPVGARASASPHHHADRHAASALRGCADGAAQRPRRDRPRAEGRDAAPGDRGARNARSARCPSAIDRSRQAGGDPAALAEPGTRARRGARRAAQSDAGRKPDRLRGCGARRCRTRSTSLRERRQARAAIPPSFQQLEQAIAAMRHVGSHVASDGALAQLAAEVHGLASTVRAGRHAERGSNEALHRAGIADSRADGKRPCRAARSRSRRSAR